jgi:hypothetical protein
MSTPQEYWDACLIKTWRNDGKLLDAIQMFRSIVGKDHWELDEPLLRVPAKGVPWGLYVKPFVAAHLEKISNRLWEQPPEKDVLLLKKLKTSKYDTTTVNTNRDSEMNKERERYRTNRVKVGMNTLATSIRNSSTDWNTVKGSRSRTR